MKFSRISDWLTDFFHDQFKSFASRSDYSMGLIAIALFCLSIVSWKLLLAIAFGITVAWTAFEIQHPHSNWVQSVWQKLNQLWQTASGRSIIAGGSSTLLLLSGFGLAEATGRGWIAATLMLQGCTSASIFALWQQNRRAAQAAMPPATEVNTEVNLDRYIYDLTHPTLMRRLIAVKRLRHLGVVHAIAPCEYSEIQDYFQALLAQETDPTIRMALQEGLADGRDHRDRPALAESSATEFSVQVRDISEPGRSPSLSAANF